MSTGDLLIRQLVPQNSRDYDALARLHNYATPEDRTTPLALQVADQFRNPKFVCRRFVAEQNGVIKGYGVFEHSESAYHPDKYLFNIVVDPAFQSAGIGSKLYSHVVQELERLNPQTARTWVLKDYEPSIRFAEKCSFARGRIKWNIVLDVQSCNLNLFQELIEAIYKDEIFVKSVSELKTDLNYSQKFYELYVRITKSIDSPDEETLPSFEDFAKNNSFNENTTFVATHQNQYIGMWQLDSLTGGVLYGGIMGVDQAYRRRGAALALTYHAVKFAKEFKYKTLTAHTDERNQAILTLAERFGFTHLPAQVLFIKDFRQQK